ncbi:MULTISPECIES: DUF4489 domain-containing protein [Clostridium]|uniref:DUF4489 domain-containing protein n=1 Tax=Clostridium botulinum (strain Eklund 17B / Type B) TaxID=935198 RepID=B2TLM3_CLOBB|nr:MULTISPECIES: DUF4489 domain-containing protein [Clostridium]ACD24401.1 conserved hypothetical protein [Clostridium botulinum B str. Eklund 17B (NRP)]MBN1045707.1 DUF4489 domain-containing protein [Clostridium botulinum]MBY6976934.1 DUF4489 domain-containing protein [Clostridium botulinum]MBY7002114.1 DUF4489 domain-containing protein [Clostridium botulinum]MCR1272828.1 DUF4489 domain-containing protein [Clostridium botulinum]
MNIMEENGLSDYNYCSRNDYQSACNVGNNRDSGQKPGRAILKCGCGGSAPIPVVSVNALGTVRPLPLASVTIDTSKLKCPTTVLTFTCEIKSVLDVSLRLNFLIKKSAKNGCCEYICGTHSFSDVIEFAGTQTFSFQVCDNSSCDDCVTYSVEYVPIDFILNIGGSINNAALTALAVENLC